MITIKKVDQSAIPLIKELAFTTWQATYKEILSPEQMDYMLHLFYSDASLKKQMEHAHQFIMAFEKDIAVGFASYSPKVHTNKTTCHLHKLYVDPAMQGKGIGQLLLGYIINDLEERNFSFLHLNVNRHNNAVNFYKKLGFEIIGEEDVDIGNGYFMNDYIMEKRIR